VEILEYTFDNLIIGATEEINIDVSQESIEHFARLSGDFSPIHIDESFAKESGFESQVVHGMLLGAFVSRLIGMKLPGKFGVLQKIDLGFRKPCYAPSKLTIRGTIETKSAAVKLITLSITILQSTDVIIAKGKASVMIRK
jgi:3-hydroxybutyryl-CoA dehydratase